MYILRVLGMRKDLIDTKLDGGMGFGGNFDSGKD